MRVMSCCFCRMTQIRFFVLDAQSLNHPFISARLAKLFILGTVVEINWPPAALNLAQQRTCAQKCDHICCNLMSLYNVFFFCPWKTQCNLSGMCCFPVFFGSFWGFVSSHNDGREHAGILLWRNLKSLQSFLLGFGIYLSASLVFFWLWFVN